MMAGRLQKDHVWALRCALLQMLRAELEGQRKRAADLEEMVAAVRNGSMSAGTSNKKDEDAYDVEAGGPAASSSSFKPIASMVRKAPPPLNHHFMVHAARRVDRVVAMLDKRPGARVGLLLYFVLLHFFVILF